jgi:hypothetical protein
VGGHDKPLAKGGNDAALADAAVAATAPALAAEPAVISLSCNGTVASDPEKPDPVKNFGLFVTPAAHTVSGFSVVAHIDVIDDANVHFSGEQHDALGGSSIMGTIDRVTGAAWVNTFIRAQDGKLLETRKWDLLCKVTNRLF